MWKLLVAFLLIASPAFAERQSTAYGALKVVSRQVSPLALSRVLSVTGVDGDPQPARWNILVVDRHTPGGVREIQVADGKVIAQGPPANAVAGSARGATIPTAKLNLDSSGAFAVANHTADTAHLNFSFLAYTLRTNERGQPVWIVTLQDEARKPLGIIHINANRGGITRVEGLYQGANMANVEQAPVGRGAPGRRPPPQTVIGPSGDDYADTATSDGSADDDEGNENVVKAELKRLFRHSRTEGERIFRRARSSFQEFMNR